MIPLKMDLTLAVGLGKIEAPTEKQKKKILLWSRLLKKETSWQAKITNEPLTKHLLSLRSQSYPKHLWTRSSLFPLVFQIPLVLAKGLKLQWVLNASI
jgi:hypothetical protein